PCVRRPDARSAAAGHRSWWYRASSWSRSNPHRVSLLESLVGVGVGLQEGRNRQVKASSFLDEAMLAEVLDAPERFRGRRNAAAVFEQPAPLLPRLRVVSAGPPNDGDEDVCQIEDRSEE